MALSALAPALFPALRAQGFQKRFPLEHPAIPAKIPSPPQSNDKRTLYSAHSNWQKNNERMNRQRQHQPRGSIDK
jgi:hypothetical protein